MIKYGMYPPRWTGDTLYHKDIVTFCVEDDKIIGAKQWDINGTSEVISYMDLPYDKRLTKDFVGVTNIDTSVLLGTVIRTSWIFDTEGEAYIQKVICLNKIRDYFYNNREERKKEFDVKVPPEIEQVMDNIKMTKPEYFL